MGNTGIRDTRIMQRVTGNGGKGIPGNRFTGICTRITAGHCIGRFQTARRGWGWIMDPVQAALMKGGRNRVQTQRKQVACLQATSADTRQELTTLPYGGAHSKSILR